MPELTIEMRTAIGGALKNAHHDLVRLFGPEEGKWLVTTMLAVGFTDLLRNASPAAQAALVAAANDKLEGTRWRIAERVQ
jgi:hypothetical protein